MESGAEFDFVERKKRVTRKEKVLFLTRALLMVGDRSKQGKDTDHDFYTGCGKDCHWCNLLKPITLQLLT
jgi:hypothetical protein